MDTAIIYCPNCKAEITSGNVCEYCGTVVDSGGQAAAPVNLKANTSRSENHASDGYKPDTATAALVMRMKQNADAINLKLGNASAVAGLAGIPKILWSWLVVHTLGIAAFVVKNTRRSSATDARMYYEEMMKAEKDLSLHGTMVEASKYYPVEFSTVRNAQSRYEAVNASSSQGIVSIIITGISFDIFLVTIYTLAFHRLPLFLSLILWKLGIHV